jgi:hypothetical protein
MPLICIDIYRSSVLFSDAPNNKLQAVQGPIFEYPPTDLVSSLDTAPFGKTLRRLAAWGFFFASIKDYVAFNTLASCLKIPDGQQSAHLAACRQHAPRVKAD